MQSKQQLRVKVIKIHQKNVFKSFIRTNLSFWTNPFTASVAQYRLNCFKKGGNDCLGIDEPCKEEVKGRESKVA